MMDKVSEKQRCEFFPLFFFRCSLLDNEKRREKEEGKKLTPCPHLPQVSEKHLMDNANSLKRLADEEGLYSQKSSIIEFLVNNLLVRHQF
jgi:hypothetical protein